ncbi:MAG: EthD family reductase [Chloroflexota bacterium]|nr:EthD family reductase [Chloroflexota bacterium]
MVKFTILFRKAVNTERNEHVYQDFLALIERMPDVQRRQANTVLGSPFGDSPYYRVLEVYFKDFDTLNASLRSPAGQEAGGELQRLPPGSFEMYFADVYEEAGGKTP